MKSKDMSVISNILQQLDARILETAQRLITNGQIGPHKEEFSFWEMDNFEYTSTGIQNTGGTLKTLKRDNWLWASHKISEILYGDKLFIEAELALKVLFTSADKNALKNYCGEIISICLNNLTRSNILFFEDIKKRFLRDLNEEPFNAKVHVELNGIILESKEIILDLHTIIRQTTKSDLEIPQANDVNGIGYGPRHTAILQFNWKLKERSPMFLQSQMARCVCLLRLFCLGSVQSSTYEFSSDLIILSNIRGKVSSNNIVVWKNYYLKKERESILKYFIKKFIVPEQLYSLSNNVDYITVAYDRFKESLLEIVKFERRITNAVMGIEALLSNANTELKFRMQTRISKLLGCFGFEPLIVRRQMDKAYEIRSTFAHGNILVDKEKAKLTADYRDVDNFALIIIDYLRILLIISIGSGLTKNALIALLDDSFIDDAKGKQLKKEMRKLKPFINSNIL